METNRDRYEDKHVNTVFVYSNGTDEALFFDSDCTLTVPYKDVLRYLESGLMALKGDDGVARAVGYTVGEGSVDILFGQNDTALTVADPDADAENDAGGDPVTP